VTIEQIIVSDRPTSDYLASVPEEHRVDALVNVIQLGARACQFASDRLGAADVVDHVTVTSKNVTESLASLGTATSTRFEELTRALFGDAQHGGAVHRHVRECLAEFEQQFKVKLDPQHKDSFSRRLAEVMTADLKRSVQPILAALNRDDPTSPFNALERLLSQRDQRIETQLKAIMEANAARSAAGAERERGTAKGDDFEAAVEAVLAPLCRPRHDLLSRVGALPGALNKKAGDFTIKVNPTEAGSDGLAIVLETKNDRSRIGDIIRELDRAKENRGAVVAIGITTNPNVLVDGPPIIFPAPDKAIVRVDFANGVVRGAEAIEIALEAMRFLALQLRDRDASSVDAGEINALVKEAIGEVGKIAELRRRLTAAASAVRDADDCAVAVRAAVKSALEKILTGLVAQLNRPNTAA
jgi:hypothetical protein